MRLDDLQNAFQGRVLAGSPGIEAELVDSDADDFAARLGAYTQGYRSRLVEALGVSYPALKALLGDEEFDAAMRRYIDTVPSRHYSVRYYGATVAEYVGIDRQQPLAQLVADLATWEWLLAEVFDGPDDNPVDAAALAAVPPQAWATVSFRFRGTVRRTVTHSNAVQWWRSLQDECETPESFESAPAVQWLVWRQELKTLFRSMDADEAGALDAAVAGASFGALCERIAVSVGAADAPLRAASLLRSWFSEGLVAEVCSDRPVD